MSQESQKVVAVVPFYGKKVEVFANPSQWSELKYSGGKFWINKGVADENKLNSLFDQFCDRELVKIVQRQIDSLVYKSIWVNLPYTRGQEKFTKKTKISVYEYLKLINFSQKIEFKIGSYEKEWGINEIDPKQKKFILYFNLNLIKYDNGEHIRYVVAHELAHIFCRDHGTEFNKVLENLFPSKANSEDFFSNRIRFVFGNTTTNYTYFYLILAIFVVLILWSLLSQFLNGFEFQGFATLPNTVNF